MKAPALRESESLRGLAQHNGMWECLLYVKMAKRIDSDEAAYYVGERIELKRDQKLIGEGFDIFWDVYWDVPKEEIANGFQCQGRRSNLRDDFILSWETDPKVFHACGWWVQMYSREGNKWIPASVVNGEVRPKTD